MARKAVVRWDEKANAWRSDVGPRNEAGRRAAKYFRTREIPGGGVEELPRTPAGERKANELLREYLLARDGVEARALAQRNDPFFYEVVSLYMEFAQSALKPKTFRAYQERLQVVQKFVGRDGVALGLRRVGSLSMRDGLGMLKAWRDRGLSANYVTNGLLLSAKACLQWAATEDLLRDPPRIILANPWAELRGPEAGPSDRRLVRRPELAAYLRLAWVQANRWKRDRNRPCFGCRSAGIAVARPCRRAHTLRATLARNTVLLIRLQYHCGTRPGELCAAVWSGWNPQAYRDPDTGHWWGLITIEGKNTGRKKVMREIPVRPILVRAVETFRRSRFAHPVYIFARPERAGTDLGDAPAITHWADSSELSKRIRDWRIGGLVLAFEEARARAAKMGMTPEQAAAYLAKVEPPFSPRLTLYSLRHTFYTDAIEGGETFERAGAVGDTGAATIEKTYFKHRLKARFETAKRISGRRKEDR